MRANDVDHLIAAERKILTFTLGDQMFGIDMEPLIEVREWEEPTPLPGVPHYFRGVTNLRGLPLPIIDLGKRLGWKPAALHPRSCTVVVRLSGQQAGFLVNEVADILPIRESDVQPCPEVELAEKSAIAGLVQMRRPAAGEHADGTASTVILLNLNALNVTRELELAA